MAPVTMRVTEMIIYDLFLFHLTFDYNTLYNNSGRLGKFIIYLAFSSMLFLAPEIYIPDIYGSKNRYRRLVPENGVNLWPIYGACIMGLSRSAEPV